MIPLSFLNIILLLAAAQGVLLAVLLFHKYGQLYANRFLGAYMLFYSAILLNLIFEDLGYFQKYPFLLFIQVGLPFLIGPLHFLYAKYLTHSSLKFKKNEWLHLLPGVVYEIVFLYFYFRSEAGVMPLSRSELNKGLPLIYTLFNWAIAIQGLIYMFLTLSLLKKYARDIKDVFSTTEQVQLDWLRNITYIITFVLCIFLIENALLLGDVNLSDFFNFSSLLSALAIYVMGYLGLFKSEIFAKQEIAETIRQLPRMSAEAPMTHIAADENAVKRYEKSGLSVDRAKKYVDELRQLMEDKKIYTDCDLTLNKLAAALSISPHNLSEVINTQLDQNFFDLINHYRLEEVKKNLADPAKQHLTILAIAFDAGFNSKTSFNTIFKKHEKMTPSEYRKKVLFENA